MLKELIRIANTLDQKGLLKEADMIDNLLIKLASIADEGGLQEPENSVPSSIVDEINDSNNNLLVLNKVADDLTEFFKSFSESEEFENMSLDKFTNYRRVPENELKEQNPQVVKVIETTNDILDDVLLHSLQQDQAILNIAKNNGISDSVIVDAIYHMIGSHNPLNANQVQAALYEVAN